MHNTRAAAWQSGYLKHPCAFFFFSSLRAKIQWAPSLLWQSEPCHQRYKTPLPLTCSIVWIMLSDHFNRLCRGTVLAECAGWGMRLGAEEASWKITQNAASPLCSQGKQAINFDTPERRIYTEINSLYSTIHIQRRAYRDRLSFGSASAA